LDSAELPYSAYPAGEETRIFYRIIGNNSTVCTYLNGFPLRLSFGDWPKKIKTLKNNNIAHIIRALIV
jgi:hypothetical protein